MNYSYAFDRREGSYIATISAREGIKKRGFAYLAFQGYSAGRGGLACLQGEERERAEQFCQTLCEVLNSDGPVAQDVFTRYSYEENATYFKPEFPNPRNCSALSSSGELLFEVVDAPKKSGATTEEKHIGFQVNRTTGLCCDTKFLEISVWPADAEVMRIGLEKTLYKMAEVDPFIPEREDRRPPVKGVDCKR